MPSLGVHEIRERAKKIVLEHSGGIRCGEIVDILLEHSPETSPQTIRRSVSQLVSSFPELVHKPSRGLYAPVNGAAL